MPVRLVGALVAALRAPPGRPLRTARLGERVVVRGAVVPRDLLDAPLSGRRCVYYRYSLETWRRSTLGALAGDGFWERTEADEAITEFYLDDGEGRILVSPVGAVVTVPRRREPRAIDLGGGRRARELTIAPGDHVEVTADLADAIDLFDEGRDYRSDGRRLALMGVTLKLLGPRD